MNKAMIMKFLLPGIVIALMIGGCCTKKYCIEEHAVSLRLFGFDYAEIDTVYVTGYTIGSSFSDVAVSRFMDTVSRVKNDDSSYSYPGWSGHILSDTYEWELYLPALNRTYQVGGYRYDVYSCNCPRDKTRSLARCTINGVDKSVSPAQIIK